MISCFRDSPSVVEHHARDYYKHLFEAYRSQLLLFCFYFYPNHAERSYQRHDDDGFPF